MKIFFYALIFFFIALIVIHFIQLKDREYFKCNLNDNTGNHSCFKEMQNDNSVKLKESKKKDGKIGKQITKLKEKIDENRKKSNTITDYLNDLKKENE